MKLYVAYHFWKCHFLVLAIQSSWSFLHYTWNDWFWRNGNESNMMLLEHTLAVNLPVLVISINLLKTKHRPLYLKTESVPRCKHFHLGYKNQSVYAVSGTSRCLFSDKYKTHKYSVGRAYSRWMLNCWCITWPVGFKRVIYEMSSHVCQV